MSGYKDSYFLKSLINQSSHMTLLSPLDISTLSVFSLWPSHFIFTGAISNCPPLFPSSILDTFWPWNSSSSVIYFFLFILFMRFSRKEYWSGLSFSSPVGHILSEFFTMTHPSWVTLHSIDHSFIKLCKLLSHDKAVIQEIYLCTHTYIYIICNLFYCN